MLTDSRCKQVVSKKGIRGKVKSADGNGIDTMFIDRRKSKNSNKGDTLVVCCEGNCGFYEIGLPAIPTSLGYSVLGWNHPGFGGSSGKPYPAQEQCAIDAVMQYAIHELGFKPEDIIVYGWSIGGYTSTFAAATYPTIKGLYVDASFDDVLPLAQAKMPAFMSMAVKRAIRILFDLQPAMFVRHYPGPATFVRRTHDEIISTDNTLHGNLGNQLLIKFMKARYPKLVCHSSVLALNAFVHEDPSYRNSFLRKSEVDEDLQSTLIATFLDTYDEASGGVSAWLGEDMTPDEKERMMLFLASKHFFDQPTGHNEPLDQALFQEPWRIADTVAAGYVQVAPE